MQGTREKNKSKTEKAREQTFESAGHLKYFDQRLHLRKVGPNRNDGVITKITEVIFLYSKVQRVDWEAIPTKTQQELSR